VHDVVFQKHVVHISVTSVMAPQLGTQSSEDHYTVLGVTRSATQLEIKANFRHAALACHPDKVAEARRAEATCRFQRVAEAFEVLGNEELRRKYDSQNSIAGVSTRCCSSGTSGATETRMPKKGMNSMYKGTDKVSSNEANTGGYSGNTTGSMDCSTRQRDPQPYSRGPGSRSVPKVETKTTPLRQQQQRQQQQQQHQFSSPHQKVVGSEDAAPAVPHGWNIEQVDGAVIWTRKAPPAASDAGGNEIEVLVKMGYPETDAKAALATATSLEAAISLLARKYPDVGDFSESEPVGPASNAAICLSCWTPCGTVGMSTSPSGCQVS